TTTTTTTKKSTTTTTTKKPTTTTTTTAQATGTGLPACWTAWNPKKDYNVGDKVSYQKVNYLDEDPYGGEGAEPTFNTDGGWKSYGPCA
ncbi:UNVERIFIED_CONTAM: hypothetical protein HDU68_001964, partial [Siphonaria sp. JEL0065]